MAFILVYTLPSDLCTPIFAVASGRVRSEDNSRILIVIMTLLLIPIIIMHHIAAEFAQLTPDFHHDQ